MNAPAKIAITLLILCTHFVHANDAENFVNKLKSHYKDTLHIKAFSLNHHFLNKRYRGKNYWDFNMPNRAMSIRTVEIDLEKKHYYDNDILYFPGGLLYDRVQFQNDTEGYFYEKSGAFLGKAIIKQDMNRFDAVASYLVMKLDFIAVRLNAEKAEQAGLDFTFGLYHPDVEERYYGEVSNANMSNIEVETLPLTNVELVINKADLTRVALGQITLDELLKSGQAGIKGNAELIGQLAASLDEFDGMFEILPMPTK